MNGWWKFHRKMLDHAVFSLPGSHYKIWITILSLVNHKDADWWDGSKRLIIEAGSFITSQDHLASISFTSRQAVRAALRNLIAIGSISTKITTKKHTQIFVINWDTYSGEDSQANQETNQRPTNAQPRANQEPTITGEVKKEEKERREQLHCEAGASRNGNEARSVLDFLNRKAGRNYRPSDTNLDFIRARLKSGIADWQLKAIVSRKTAEWRGTEQEKYLRPATLFNKTKCEQYLGELPKEDANGLPGMREGVATGSKEMLVRMDGTIH